MIETARPVLESMVLMVTGVKVVSLHHDIGTLTGEEVVLLTLAAAPGFREKKSRSSPTEILCRMRSGCDPLLDRARVFTIRAGRQVSIFGLCI